MLSPIIIKLLNTAESKFNSYLGLLNYRYQNLCVKAEPVSMLPVEVEMDGPTFRMEEVADVRIHEWNQLMVLPRDEEYITYIGHSIMMVHPEFKQKVTRFYIEQIDKSLKVLLLTMPPVNRDRRDLLNEGTDTLYDQCIFYYDKTKTDTGVAIAKCAADCSKEQIEEARKKLKELYDQYRKAVEGMRDNKKKEIADAYEKYVKEHGEDGSDGNSDADEITHSMNLPK